MTERNSVSQLWQSSDTGQSDQGTLVGIIGAALASILAVVAVEGGFDIWDTIVGITILSFLNTFYPADKAQAQSSRFLKSLVYALTWTLIIAGALEGLIKLGVYCSQFSFLTEETSGCSNLLQTFITIDFNQEFLRNLSLNRIGSIVSVMVFVGAFIRFAAFEKTNRSDGQNADNSESVLNEEVQPPTSSIEEQQLAADRSISKAAWVAIIASVVMSLLSLVYTIWSDTRDRNLEAQRLQEALTVSASRHLGDYPLEIRPFTPTSSIMSTFWEIVISNNGEQSISVTSLEVLQSGGYMPVAGEYIDGPSSYSGIYQGLFVMDPSGLRSIQPPINVPPGESIGLLAKIGILTHDDSSEYIGDFLSNEADNEEISVEQFLRYLYSNGTDHYGNRVDQLVEGEDVWRFAVDPVEQYFGLIVETSRGSRAVDFLSWYEFSGI